MRITVAFAFAGLLAFSAEAWSQDAPIKIDFAPLLSKLDNDALADSVRGALSQKPFQSVSGSGADVLTLTAPDGVDGEHEQFMFTVVFSRDGDKLGEAVESCPRKKLPDCTDQLVIDVKTAAR
jgi:hypothetical protein